MTCTVKDLRGLDYPPVIYLQPGAGADGETTWCDDQINDDDPIYVRVIDADELDMTVDELRECANRVRNFINTEIAIRRQLGKARPLEREKWMVKERKAIEVLAALTRVLEYIATTSPADRLPGRAVQANIFDN